MEIQRNLMTPVNPFTQIHRCLNDHGKYGKMFYLILLRGGLRKAVKIPVPLIHGLVTYWHSFRYRV